MKNIVLPLALMFLQFSCKSQLDIVDKPILFDNTRKELTLDYLEDRYGLKQDAPDIDPKMIVLHWTAIPTFEGSWFSDGIIL